MKVEIKLDSEFSEPKVVILTDKVTDEVNEIVRRISETSADTVLGFIDEKVSILEPRDILRIYAANSKVYAVTDSGEYILRPRLYEMEERLKSQRFARISNSEIINLKKVKNFDLSLSGTICVTLSDGTKTYVSRRYVSRIKEILGI